MRTLLGGCVACLVAGLLWAVPLAGATTGQSGLSLRGGDTLEADAFHCGVYLSSCSWSTSSKLVGTTPRRASWIQNNAEIQAHGPLAKITLGKSTNVEITFKSKTLIKTRWRNTKSWIADSAGKVSPSKTTVFISVRSAAYASHPTFGKPGPVIAYAGAV